MEGVFCLSGKTLVSWRLSDSRDDAWLKGTWKYERVIWEKETMPGGKKEALPPQFPLVLLLSSRFLIYDPTILEPETGYQNPPICINSQSANSLFTLRLIQIIPN